MTFSSSLCRCYVDRFPGGYEGGKEIQIQCRSREGQRHIGKVRADRTSCRRDRQLHKFCQIMETK